VDRKAIQAALETKQETLERIHASFTMEDDGKGEPKVVISTEQYNDYLSTLEEAKTLQGILAATKSAEEIKEWMASPDGNPAAAAEAAAAQQQQQIQQKDLASLLMETEEFKNRNQNHPNFRVEFDGFNAHEAKAIYGGGQTPTGGTTSYNALGGATDVGITEMRLRQQHIRDLFPKATTTDAVLIGVRETGFTNNAAVVNVRNSGNTDWQIKPESTITLAPVSYPVATVAHWLVAHQNILADAPRLKDFLNRRMLDGLMLAEDREILYGTAGAESITGITNTSGVQAYTGLATDQLSAQIRRGVTLASIAQYEPNGIAMHPTDWETLELEQTATGEYRIAISVAIGGQKRIWQMQIVATTAVTAGHWLLGSFGLGAQLYDRQKASVLVSTEDSDNFRKNLITIRAEERAALEVGRPESFVYGAVTAYTG
jgi:HK97 family phage major capsid protein